MDDDDAFLYGETSEPEPAKTVLATSVPQPISYETVQASNGLVESLEAKAEEEEPPFGPGAGSVEPEIELEAEENGVGEGEESDDDEDDIEIIMDQPSRSLDLRKNAPARTEARSTSATHSTPNRPPPSTLTTEYTLRDRNALSRPPAVTPAGPSQTPSSAAEPPATDPARIDEGPDPSMLPPASAPPSHPSINPSMPGVLDGRSILEVDMTAMAEKPWRRPGSDISDWFNYGFDEISWEAYCYRRRDLGELANVLKTNVLNFAGMPEDQLTALPPELRTMVMTGANAMMATGGPNPNMMGAGVGMNPMMDMSGMGPMNMGPMGMQMNGDMSMQMQPGGPMMQDGPGPVQGGTNGTPEQGVQMGMQDGYGVGGPGPGMMGMGMGNDFGMQQEQGPMGQPMYAGMEGSATPGHPPVQGPPVPAPGPTGAGRGASPAQFRGRGMPQGLRGRGAFGGRGRGRYGSDNGPPPPVRPASPLPPGVPTGPRNQNRYKDRDGNAPAVDGLDYGGTAKDTGGRTPSGEPEERSLSRKRRISPGLDDGRGSKRR